MANTISTANFIAVPTKVYSVYGLEETASALVEDTLTVNQLGDERLGHLSGRGSHLELRIRLMTKMQRVVKAQVAELETLS